MKSPETVTTPVLTEDALKELKALLDKARQEQEEGLWEATENTTDLMIFLVKYGEEISRLTEIGRRYEESDGLIPFNIKVGGAKVT